MSYICGTSVLKFFHSRRSYGNIESIGRKHGHIDGAKTICPEEEIRRGHSNDDVSDVYSFLIIATLVLISQNNLGFTDAKCSIVNHMTKIIS